MIIKYRHRSITTIYNIYKPALYEMRYQCTFLSPINKQIHRQHMKQEIKMKKNVRQRLVDERQWHLLCHCGLRERERERERDFSIHMATKNTSKCAYRFTVRYRPQLTQTTPEIVLVKTHTYTYIYIYLP